MVAPESCLVSKLRHFVALTDEEAHFLRQLERHERRYARGEVIRAEGDPAEELFVVKSGWVTLWTLLQNGRRLIYDIHFPGDLLGSRDVVLDEATVTMTAVTEAVVCPFPKAGLEEVFVSWPRIAALMFSLSTLETTTVFDRLRAIARMDASQRLGFFLLQIISRLRVTQKDHSDTIELPLSQELIGDALGLSQVHVNRTMRELEENGYIARGGRGRITVRFERLAEFSEFHEKRYRVDTSWLPSQR
jgi:CRP-like cAMP-binding protein